MECRRLAKLLSDLGRNNDRQGPSDSDFPLDQTVLASLPEGIKVTAAKRHGTSNIWYATGLIEAIDTEDQVTRYFVKYSAGALGHRLIEGEYNAMKTLELSVPEATPKPLAWGKLSLDGYFYLSSFIQFDQSSLPDPAVTTRVVSQLHLSSMGTSKLFGSAMPMYDGIFCHVDGWETSWKALFSKVLWQAYSLDRCVNGSLAELDSGVMDTLNYVVPRLLDDLDRAHGGIKPCFLHGDLWEGNIRREVCSGHHFIFDSNGYYGHNEADLAYWRTKHHRMSSLDYCSKYFEHIKPSEPASECYDRIKLYGIKACLMYAANEKTQTTRLQALEDMNDLLEKYGPHTQAETEFDKPLTSSFAGFATSERLDNEVAEILQEIVDARDNGNCEIW